MTQGSGVTSPIGTGRTMTPNIIEESSVNQTNPQMAYGAKGQGGIIEGKALESGGANVGGLVKGREKEQEEMVLKYATASDEKDVAQVEAYDEQVDDYMKAYEGENNEKKSIEESIESAGEEYLSGLAVNPLYGAYKGYKGYRDSRKGEQSGMQAARDFKRKDRKADRERRKELGLKGKEKRLARKAQRKSRRSAFKDFKANLALQAEDKVFENSLD
tara:strand:- start:160 stop:810 length:651 start_codon:yes stop_codon:yes gene_type:complete